MAKIKKGDLVQVITGKKQDKGGDRGKQGKVLEILSEQNRVIVEGVNYVTKHNRVGQSQRGTVGRVVEGARNDRGGRGGAARQRQCADGRSRRGECHDAAEGVRRHGCPR